MQSVLNIYLDIKQITFQHVHCLGKKDNKNKYRPIVAKFQGYKCKDLVKSKGKGLKGTKYGMNNKYPNEIQERKKCLLPVMQQQCKRESVDKLYINGQL